MADSSVEFFADKNFPETLAKFIRNTLGYKGLHYLADPNDDACGFASDTPDEVWIPEVAKRGWMILTRDRDIITDDAIYQIFTGCKAKAIFLAEEFGSMSRLNMTVWFFERWHSHILKARGSLPGDVFVAHLTGRTIKVDPEEYRKRIKARIAANKKKHAGKPQGLGKKGRQAEQARKAAKPKTEPVVSEGQAALGFGKKGHRV